MGATIPHIAEAAAARFGAGTALIMDDRRWSYEEVWREARRAASACLANGISPGDRVAVWAPNAPEWIFATLGAQIAGAALVPINTRLKGTEAADILRRARCSHLFTVSQFLGMDYSALLNDHELPALKRTLHIDRDWATFLAEGRGEGDPAVDAALARLTGDAISDILFTSGTTGAPKGVMSTHDSVLRMFRGWSTATSLRQGDRMLIASPFFHTFGYKAGWVACLLVGAVSVPMAVFEVKRAWRHILEDGVSFVPGPPTIFQSLLDDLPADLEGCSLRVGVTGAATVPPLLVERMQRELGFATVLTGYGMTECGTISMSKPGDPISRISNTCGVPLPFLELRCVGEDGVPVPTGDPGEVTVRGPGTMLGYLDDPAATAETIDAEGWLHTGDVGVLDAQGYLQIVDRKKDMYICGGFNCYPAEIERMLERHPAIDRVAVIGIPDPRLGEVGAAFVILRPSHTANEAEMIAWAREQMANYKAPRRVLFVDALPQNAAGKVAKTLLRASAVREPERRHGAADVVGQDLAADRRG
jgi:acyl-CoA synthetase (AMP-forming)/AMP-acid ligase II